MNSPFEGYPARILITRLRFIGDVVLTLPLIEALKNKYPDAELYYLTEKSVGEILIGHPDLEEVIMLDRDAIENLPWRKKSIEHLGFINKLRNYKFDMVIDLFCNPRSALLTLATGAKIRVGFDVRLRGIVYNHKIRRGASIRVVDAYLDCLRTLGIDVDREVPHLPLLKDERRWATDWLRENSLSQNLPLIGFNPGASWPAKMWQPEQFAGLGDNVIDMLNGQVLITQGPGQRELVRQVSDLMKHPPVIADLLPIRRLSALIEQCDAYVSNDSGPMHIAAAVGTRTIGIFGPSDPAIWFPYSESSGHLSVKPDVAFCCGKNFCAEPRSCISTISVDQVYRLVRQALEASP